MIEVFVPGHRWDPDTERFSDCPDTTLHLEHSLISLHKWEAYYHKSFLSTEKTYEETRKYYECMCMDKNVPPEVFKNISDADAARINAYINDPYTATKIYTSDGEDDNGVNPHKILTAEEIYYSMIAFRIPSEYRKWHLNQLLTLINVCYEKQKEAERSGEKPKPMSKEAIMKRRELNAMRKAKLHTTG
jgi:hypothetical protein